jgi:murein DD-endopeptidase MepM/ murein hydrolase activator NlpD
MVLLDPAAPEPLEPESSAADEEILDDAPEEPPHVILVGCDLALSGGLDPESWSRELWLGAPMPRIVENGHLDKEGRWIDYEQIARRPERPEWYGAYRYGVAGGTVVSGYDLDKPDDEQRRGHMNAVGHGGVDLVAELGAPIKALRLEHQVGDAEVLYVGPLYGETVVTRQAVREGGVAHDYLVIYGHLDHAGDDVRRGQRLREGAVVGYVGNSDSPSLVHLHLETRRVREGVDAWKLPGDALHAREYSVVGDPRNVLPLLAPALRTPRCAPRLAPQLRRYWLGEQMTLTLE